MILSLILLVCEIKVLCNSLHFLLSLLSLALIYKHLFQSTLCQICWDSLVRTFIDFFSAAYLYSIDTPSVPVAFKLTKNHYALLLSSSTKNACKEIFWKIRYLGCCYFHHATFQYTSSIFCFESVTMPH